MSNYSIEANTNNIIENLASSINNSSKNIIEMSHPLKLPVSDQLIFFKEDILKDVKQFESQITIKYNSEFSKNNNKMTKIEETLEEMSQKLEKISSSINLDNILQIKIDKLSELFSRLEQRSILHEVKIKNTNNKLTETIDKFNTEISESIIYPTIIGPNCKYKSFHEFIDFVILNINALLLFKEKIYMELKDFKSKAETNMNNFQVRLDYQTKNCNAFTSASIRSSEQKMRNVFNDNLNTELNNINENIENFRKNLEQNILWAINNSEKIKAFEQNFEKIETKRKENQTKISINQEESLFKPKNKKRISRKASSIVKQYIEGKLKDDELFIRRRSLGGNISNFENIKDKMDTKGNHNSYKNIKIFKENLNSNNNNDTSKIAIKKIPLKSQPNNDLFDEDESYLYEEDSESYIIDMDIESQKNKIKDEIKDVLFNNAKNNKKFRNSKEEKDDIILSYLRFLFNDTQRKIDKNKIVITPRKEQDNINNEIKLIKDDENIPINKNLYITNNNEKESVNIPKKENNNNIPNITSKRASIMTLQLSKINPPNISQNININEKFQANDVKEIIGTVKRQSKANLLPIKPPINPIKNQPQKIENQLYKNKSLKFITTKSKSRNKIMFNLDNKNNNNQNNRIIPQNYSFNKQNQRNNLFKKEINNINMNFSSFNESDKEKEKDEQKMKSIFNQIKDVIQEDEKIIIKNRFVNYGYKKEIIFAEDKKNENKNNIFSININTHKDRPKSRIIKNE